MNEKQFFFLSWKCLKICTSIFVLVTPLHQDSNFINATFTSIENQARDPDLIKDVLISEFNSFRSNDFNLSKKYDPLLAPNPFFTVDDEWREGRKTIIPAFSQNKVWKTQILSKIRIFMNYRIPYLDDNFTISPPYGPSKLN